MYSLNGYIVKINKIECIKPLKLRFRKKQPISGYLKKIKPRSNFYRISLNMYMYYNNTCLQSISAAELYIYNLKNTEEYFNVITINRQRLDIGMSQSLD